MRYFFYRSARILSVTLRQISAASLTVLLNSSAPPLPHEMLAFRVGPFPLNRFRAAKPSEIGAPLGARLFEP